LPQANREARKNFFINLIEHNIENHFNCSNLLLLEKVFSFQRRLVELKNKSCSVPNFGVNLMLELFTMDELTDPRYNVNGVSSKGNNDPKLPLDVERVTLIRETALAYVEGGEDTKTKAWIRIKNAMNKKMLELKRERRLRN
jgi:hypothetical protein